MEVEIHLEPGRQGSLPQRALQRVLRPFGMPPGFLDVSGQPASGAAVPPVASNMDPVVLQMMRQQMLLTQSMMDFMTRSAQSTVPPMPGAQVPASSGQGASSGSAPSEKLTMDTKWIPAAPLPDWKS